MPCHRTEHMNYAGINSFPDSQTLMIYSAQWQRSMPWRTLQLAWSGLQTLLVVTISLLPGFAFTADGETVLTLSKSLQQILQEALEWSDPQLRPKTLQEFYQQRAYSPIWVNGNGTLPRADMLLHALEEADQEGLNNATYPVKQLKSHWNAWDTDELALLEVQLSNAALEYGRDLQIGPAPPEAVFPLWHIPQAGFDGIALLEKLADDEITSTLKTLSPPYAEYQRLRSSLSFYRQLASLGGWPTIPPGPTLKVGDSHPQVALLRERLFIEGDLVLDISEQKSTFDELLKLAVERFQVRHGLNVDGTVGPSTRAAMNVSVEKRIEQIKLNMERWRWLPRDPGERYIMVNIPGFQLTAYEKGKPVLVMEVIVGSGDRPTPIVSGNLHSVVFNPSWTAPRVIVVKDLIPKQRQNPEFLSSRNIRVYLDDVEIDPLTVDWRKINFSNLPYVLRQDPGPLNPMGRVKFLFNNRFDVYLHDTPQQGLFTKAKRAFSSGCVRVSEPEELARFVLAGNGNGWNENAVRKALYGKNTQTVTLNTALPVYLLYFTVWVGSDNRAQFRNDVYQLDGTPRACPGSQELNSKSGD